MLKDKIDNDLKEAMKNKDAAKVSTLRFLKASLVNAEIDKGQELADDDVIAVIKRQIRQRNESIEEFKKGNRQDLVDKETKELGILRAYLPEELKPEEVLIIIRESIKETGAASPRDMGKVMKVAMQKLKGRADGKLVSSLVNQELSKGGSAS